MGKAVLTSHGLDFDAYFYWISVAALFSFTIVFDLGFVLALTYLKRKLILVDVRQAVYVKVTSIFFILTCRTFVKSAPNTSRAIISKKKMSQLKARDDYNASAKLDNESTTVAVSQSIAGTRKNGETKLLDS